MTIPPDTRESMMEQYSITGMSCAACQARVEKAVSKVPGVTQCAVSLLTNSMGVEGDADEKDIIRAVQDAGYGAVKRGDVASRDSAGAGSGAQDRLAMEEEALADHETIGKKASDYVESELGATDRIYQTLFG